MLDQQTKQQLQQKWQQVKPQVKQTFPGVTDADLDKTNGDADRLSSTIEQKTGQDRTQIERTIRQLVSTS